MWLAKSLWLPYRKFFQVGKKVKLLSHIKHQHSKANNFSVLTFAMCADLHPAKIKNRLLILEIVETSAFSCKLQWYLDQPSSKVSQIGYLILSNLFLCFRSTLLLESVLQEPPSKDEATLLNFFIKTDIICHMLFI